MEDHGQRGEVPHDPWPRYRIEAEPAARIEKIVAVEMDEEEQAHDCIRRRRSKRC